MFMRELIDFIRPLRLPVAPLFDVKKTQDILGAIKRPVPRCWICGFQVDGLSAGYRLVSVNIDLIQSAA